MKYFLEFSAEEDNTTMPFDALAPLATKALLCGRFRPNDSSCSLQLSDLEDFHFSEQRPSSAQMANPGGMWQAINKRSPVDEGERPAKRSKGSFVQRTSSQINVYQAVSAKPSNQATQSAPQR